MLEERGEILEGWVEGGRWGGALGGKTSGEGVVRESAGGRRRREGDRVRHCSRCEHMLEVFFLLCGIVSKSAFRPRLAASDTDLAPAQTGGELIPAVLTKQRHEGTLERINIDKVIQSQHHRYRVL